MPALRAIRLPRVRRSASCPTTTIAASCASAWGRFPGEIVDLEGHVLGHHEGTYNFTIGQRKGLRVAARDPRYVVGIEAAHRRVVTGIARDAQVGTVRAEGLVWHRRLGEEALEVQVRSAAPPVPVSGMTVAGDRLTVLLEVPAAGVATGQTVVVYEGDRAVVAGTITSTERWAAADR